MDVYRYKATFTQEESGFWLARCPSVRGAATDSKIREEAELILPDALMAAIGGLMSLGCDIPASDPMEPGAKYVELEPRCCHIIAAYMIDQQAGNLSRGRLKKYVDLFDGNWIQKELDKQARA